MCATFTDEDVGKLVERADGTVIGTVASLEEGRARVEPAPDVIDQLLIRLDRAEPGDPFILAEDDVREISERRIHLAAEFSKESVETTSTSEPTDQAAAGDSQGAQSDQADGSDSGAEPETSNRADGAGAVATPSSDSSGVGPFDTRFQTGAAVVSGISILLGLLFFWFGYDESSLLGVGPELNIISGVVGFMLFAFFGIVALVMAVYMEPGLDQ